MKKIPQVLAVILVMSSMISSCFCREFFVGGANGWISDPSENYSIWSSKNQFLVNDILVFNCSRNGESVLVVDREKYKFCNTTNPTIILQGGHVIFPLDRSGEFYFITNDMVFCKLGQKLKITVMGQQRNIKLSSSTHSPSPSPQPKKPSPHHDPHPKRHHHHHHHHQKNNSTSTVTNRASSVSPSPAPHPSTHAVSSATFVRTSFFWVLILALKWVSVVGC